MTCPYLGSRQDSTTHYSYPTDENACYAEGDPAQAKSQEIGAAHQQRFCLGQEFNGCALFRTADAAESGPALSADALYEKGMAHYRRREWIEARDCFRQLKRLEPNRKAIDDLLDDLNLFIQLQTMRTPAEEPGAAAGPEEPAPAAGAKGFAGKSVPAAPKRRPPRGLAIGIVIVVVALLISLGAIFGDNFGLFSSPKPEATSLYNRGQAGLSTGDYENAMDAFQQLLTLEPNNQEALAGLEKAKRLKTLAQLYVEAQQSIKDEQWDIASEKLKSILELDPSYQDAYELSTTVERQRRLLSLFDQGKEQFDNKNWASAVTAFEQLRAMDPTFRSEVVQEYLFQGYLNDGLALIDGAGETIDPLKEAIQRFASALGLNPRNKAAIEERRLASLYLEGRQAYVKGKWDESISRVREVHGARADYANGWAAQTLYLAYLQKADMAMQGGDCPTGLDMYRLALAVGVSDHSLAQAGEATAQACITPPTATPTDTPIPTSTSPATATRPPTATRLATATPEPTATFTPPPPPPPTDNPPDKPEPTPPR